MQLQTETASEVNVEIVLVPLLGSISNELTWYSQALYLHRADDQGFDVPSVAFFRHTRSDSAICTVRRHIKHCLRND